MTRSPRGRHAFDKSPAQPVQKVLVLNQYALPRSQGGGTRHVDLFGRLSGWQPVIVAASRNHATQERFTTRDHRFVLVHVPSYDSNGARRVFGWFVYLIKSVTIGMMSRDLDVVYASTPHLLTPLAGLLIAKVRRKPLVVEVRDLWPESIVAAGQLTRDSQLHRLMVAFEKGLYNAADRIVVVTEGWQSHFASLGIGQEKLVVIVNGTELEDFRVEGSREELRRRWGIKTFTAVFAGSHGPKDGLDLILDAARASPEIQFILVGAGIAKQAAMDRAEGEGLTNVAFRETVTKRELPGLLVSCDVGIHAVTPLSVFDKGMSPNKLFDYLAAGLPVVSNARHQLRSVLADDTCGRLGGSSDLAACLELVRQADSETLSRWRDAGTKLMRVRFSRHAAALVLTNLLDSLNQR